ncbi:MAG: Putative PadR family transcriptional regulator, partial [Proteiniphilum acetatigenes]
YSLTDKGRETLRELISFWRSYTVCVDGFIDTVKDWEV